MSYRNPIFSYRHVIAELGDDVFEASTSPAFTEARMRLGDYRSQLRAVQPDVTSPAFGRIALDKVGADSVAAGGARYPRIIIPAGHNFQTSRNVDIHLAGAAQTLADGSDFGAFTLPGGAPFVVEFEDTDTVATATTMDLYYGESIDGVTAQLGELWWTNKVQSVTGIASEWNDDVTGTLDQVTMNDGATFTRIAGAPRRSFTFVHAGISGADLALYDELARHVGYGAQPFWYEHPDSGDAVVNLHASGSETGITTSDATAVNESGTGPRGDDSLLCTSTAAATASVTKTITATDMRNSVLEFELNIDTPATWFVDEGDMLLNVVSGTSPQGKTQTWASKSLVKEPRLTEWVRLHVDLEIDIKAGVVSTGQADLSEIVEILFAISADQSGRVWNIGAINLIDKAKLPKLVEMLPGSYKRKQRSKSPSSARGPIWDVSFDLIEVTT